MRNIAVLAAFAALACFGGGGEKKQPINVSDSDYGRLQSGQTQLVDAARADLAKARDEYARAKLGETDAQHEDQLAKADQAAADAEKTRAEALAKTANDSRDPGQLEQARMGAENAQLRRRTADAHMDYAHKVQGGRAAEVMVAERRVAYEASKVELAKLQALQQAKVPAASKYDAAKLEAQVAAARKDLEDAEKRVRGSVSDMMTSQRNWQELDRQLQAKLGQAGGPLR